jgi:hypothetical protein
MLYEIAAIRPLLLSSKEEIHGAIRIARSKEGRIRTDELVLCCVLPLNGQAIAALKFS